MKVDFGKKLEILNERYLNGDVSRRDFLKYLGIAGAAVGIAGGPFGPFARDALAAKSIRFDSWGGIVNESFIKYAFDPFTRETGIKVVCGEFGDQDTYLTKVKASFPPGGEFNVANLSGVFEYARYIGLEFGVVLDESKIPNLQNMVPAMIEPLRAVSKGTLSAIPYTYGQTGIGYNTKYISKEKAEKLGAALLWDKSLAGKLGSWGDWRTNIWYAALYTNQNPNDIKDMDAVWDALRVQQKMIKKYWGSGAELMSLLANEEIYATVAWSGRVAALKEQGHPIGFLSPPNCYSWMECLFVIKGSDLDTAQQLLNFLLKPDVVMPLSEAFNYPIGLDPTKVEMSEAVQKLPAFDPTGTFKGYLFAKPEYWNSHQLDWAEKWDRVMSGA